MHADADAFQSPLWKELEPNLRRLANRFSSTLSPDDLMQEAWIKFTSITSGSAKIPCTTEADAARWIYYVIQRRFIDLFRAEGLRRTDSWDEHSTAPPATVESRTEVEAVDRVFGDQANTALDAVTLFFQQSIRETASRRKRLLAEDSLDYWLWRRQFPDDTEHTDTQFGLITGKSPPTVSRIRLRTYKEAAEILQRDFSAFVDEAVVGRPDAVRSGAPRKDMK